MTKKLDPTTKKLALARVQTHSDNIKIHIAGSRSYSKDELISNIKRETKLGKQIAQIQIEFLRDLAHGKIYHGQD